MRLPDGLPSARVKAQYLRWLVKSRIMGRVAEAKGFPLNIAWDEAFPQFTQLPRMPMAVLKPVITKLEKLGYRVEVGTSTDNWPDYNEMRDYAYGMKISRSGNAPIDVSNVRYATTDEIAAANEPRTIQDVVASKIEARVKNTLVSPCRIKWSSLELGGINRLPAGTLDPVIAKLRDEGYVMEEAFHPKDAPRTFCDEFAHGMVVSWPEAEPVPVPEQ